MQTIWAISLFILALVYVFDRSVLQFDPKAFKWFIKVVLIGSSISLVVNLLLGRFPPLLPVSASSLMFVWWEDVLFSLLLMYYAEKILPKWAFVTVAAISSVVFGLGHVYQGWICVLLLSFYPYFVSYKYGKKHGYGTIMLCHVCYDFVILSNTKLIHFIGKLL